MSLDGEDLHRFLAGRRSVRRFRPSVVPAATIRRLLATAVLAPSAHNRQPWRFAVVETGPARDRLVEAMSARFLEDLVGGGLETGEAERRVERSRKRLQSAPALIILCLTLTGMDRYPDAQRRAAEQAMAVQSAALAGGHLLLAAQAEGLGACWMCAPLFVPEIVRSALALPEDWQPQAAILLGEPEAEPPEPGRIPADEVSLWR